MTRRLAATALLAIGLALAGPEGRARAAEPLVSLPDGVTYELAATTATTTVEIPLQPRQGVRPRHLAVRLVRVYRGGVQVPRNAFTVAYRPGGPSLEVTARLDAVPRPGTYSLRLLVTRARPAESEPLEIQLTRPAGTLTAPSTMQVEHTWLAWGRFLDRKPTLRLRETAGVRLTGVSIRQVESATGLVRPTQRSSGPAWTEIPARGEVEVPYRLDGRFPLGTSTRTLEVTAPQLEAPATITVEVRTRRHPAYILLAIAAGLLAGWLVRRVLTDRVTLGKARLRVLDLRGRLQRESNRHEDKPFRDALKQQVCDLDELQDGPSWDDPTALNSAVDRELDKLDKALEQLANDRAKVVGEDARFRTLLGYDWSLPSRAAAAVGVALDAAGAVAEALDGDDVTAARNALDTARRQLGQALRSTGGTWRSEILKKLEPLAGLEAPATSPAASLQEAATAARSAVRELPADPASDPEALLRRLHDARVQVARLPDSGYRLQEAARSVVEVLKDADKREPVQKLDEVAARLTEELDRAGSSEEHGDRAPEAGDGAPEAALAALSRYVPSLLDALEKAIKAQLGAADAEVRRDISRLLDEGRFLAAAVRVAAPESQFFGEGDGQPAGAVLARWRSWMGRPTGAAPPPLVVPAPVTPTWKTERTRLAASVDTAKTVQTVLVAAVLAFLGYALFIGSFNGSVENLLQIFLWAFALDLTVETLLETAKGAPQA
jgi:hypothetical protein